MKEPESKIEYIIRAKGYLREDLRAMTWPEKVRSIERMNRAQKAAKKAMSDAMEQLKNEGQV